MTTLKPTATPSVAQILEDDEDEDEGAGDSEDEIGSIDGWLTRSHSQRQFATVLKPSRSASSLPVSMQPIIRMGWMEKRGDINKSWKQRWFILRGTNLTYHKDSESAMKGETLGTLLMPGAHIELDLITGEFDPTRDLALRTFGVKTLHSERVYAFRAPTKQDRTTWVSVLETARGTPGVAAAAAADAAAQSAAKDKQVKASRWQYDELCYGCRAEFTLMKRRHHCRRCGHAHCNDCSKQKCRIPESGFDSLVRVCDDCYSQLVAPPPRQKTAAEKEEERDALARLQLLKQMEQERLAAAAVEKEKNNKNSKSKDPTNLASSPSSHIEKSPLDPEFDSDEEREKSRSPKSLDSLSPTTSFSSRMRGGTTLNGYTDGKYAVEKEKETPGGRSVSASVSFTNNNNSRSKSTPSAVQGKANNRAPNVLHQPPPPPERTSSPFTGRGHMSMNATGDDSYVAMSDDEDDDDFTSESDDENEDYASRRAKDQRRRERRKKKKKSTFCCFG